MGMSVGIALVRAGILTAKDAKGVAERWVLGAGYWALGGKDKRRIPIPIEGGWGETRRCQRRRERFRLCIDLSAALAGDEDYQQLEDSADLRSDNSFREGETLTRV